MTVLNGSGSTNEYDYPVITKDTSNYVWVAARYTGSSVYYMKAVKEDDGTNDLPEDTGDTVYSISGTSNSNSNVYGVIAPLTSQDMYATWIKNTAIEGRVWDNSGSQWEDSLGETTYPDGIDDGVTGLTNNISALSDSLGNVHLAYINSSNNALYKEYQIPSRGYDTSIWADGFESGTPKTTWDAYTDPDGDEITAVAAAAYTGTYGLNIDIDDTDNIYVQDNLTAVTNYFARVYIDPNGMQFSLQPTFLRGWDNGVGRTVVQAEIGYSAGSHQIRVSGKRDDDTWISGSLYSVTDDWHCVEVEFKQSSGSNDGYLKLWIDGELKETVSGIDNDTIDVDTSLVGRLGSDPTTGTLYFDNFASDDSRIGCYPWGSPVTLDSNTGNEYPTISLNTSNSDLYAIWIRGDDIYYKKGVSPYKSANWDVSATAWQTAGTNDWVTSNYSGNGMIFAQWTDGTGSPYSVMWNFIIIPEKVWMLLALGVVIPGILKKRKKEAKN